jgi:hypothetical protein
MPGWKNRRKRDDMKEEWREEKWYNGGMYNHMMRERRVRRQDGRIDGSEMTELFNVGKCNHMRKEWIKMR